jgi:hypothetical protein
MTRLILALALAAVLCTWEGAKKTRDCGHCGCMTSTQGTTTHDGTRNEIGRCSVCGEPM